MSQEMGEEMPPEFDEVIDRLESGQSPEEIEESMPELAEGMELAWADPAWAASAAMALWTCEGCGRT